MTTILQRKASSLSMITYSELSKEMQFLLEKEAERQTLANFLKNIPA